MPHVLDETLIELAQNGDQAAFAAIVERYQSPVYGYLRARLLRSDDAEDLTQEVFLRFYTARSRFDTSHLIRPFLLGIAKNVLREHVRKVKRRKEIGWADICLELEDGDWIVPAEEDGEDERRSRLEACISELAQPARHALKWHYAGRLPLSEVAQRLKRTAGAVKLLLFRARQSVKRCLERARPKPR
jgi:RNA polymerase sigma-70 factor (ECF subfamily)